MEERMGWKDAFGTAWGNLTGVNNDSNSVRGIRILFFLIFLGGVAWAGYSYFNYYTIQLELQDRVFTPAPPPAPLEADRKRLADMVAQVRVTTNLRKGSATMVDTMQTMGRYAFADPTLFPPSGGGTDLLPPVVVEVPEVVIEMPPEIVLRAIMIMGKQQVAVMDITGVGSGMVVRAGDTFMQKKGRIVRITPEKVVMRWGGRNFDIRPGF